MNETGRLIALAILVISALAFVITGMGLARALLNRSHTAYTMERYSASNQTSSAILRFSLSVLGLAIGWVMATLFSATDAAPVTSTTPPAVVYVTQAPSPNAQNTLAPQATSTKPPAPTSAVPVVAIGSATAPVLPTSSTSAPAATTAPAQTAIPPTKPAATNTALAQTGPTSAPTQVLPTRIPATATTAPTAAPAVNLPKSDCADPGSAGILSPAHGQTVSGQTPFIVNAGVLDGESAKIEALNDAGNWAFLARTTSGIKNGPLGMIDPSMFQPGIRQFRLVIVDTNQQERKVCRIALVLR